MALTADKLTDLMAAWIQSMVDETTARGSRFYTGIAITGTSTTPAVYATGITAPLEGDLYLYSGTGADDIGNVYICTASGDASTALWKFSHNIRGAIGANGQRGALTYDGTAITGTNATPTTYATGITDAAAGDIYRYVGSSEANIGNEYLCVQGGHEATALWAYSRNVSDGLSQLKSDALEAAESASGAAEAATTAAAAAAAANSAALSATNAANAAAYEIDGLTIEVAVVPYGTTPVATITDVDGHKHVAIQTQQGPQGPGYTIKGAAHATLAALQEAVPGPAEGDQYNVGSAAPYHVYRWTGAVWEDQGELRGPKGDAGITFRPTVSSGGVLSWENDGSLDNPGSVDLVAAVAAAMPELQPKRLLFTGISVLASSWGDTPEADTEQVGGGYAVCTTITLTDVTADMYPDVIFNVGDRESGNYSGVTKSVAGGVIIYAKETPEGTITIPTIVLWP